MLFAYVKVRSHWALAMALALLGIANPFLSEKCENLSFFCIAKSSVWTEPYAVKLFCIRCEWDSSAIGNLQFQPLKYTQFTLFNSRCFLKNRI